MTTIVLKIVHNVIASTRSLAMVKNNQQKYLDQLNKILGTDIELPVEQPEDHIREGQSVINYFKSAGEGFYRKECKQCEKEFAYAYNINGVQYCGIPCMKEALQAIGLDWDPKKPAHLRWGRYVPAVVSPLALKELDAILEDQRPDRSESEPPSTRD